MKRATKILLLLFVFFAMNFVLLPSGKAAEYVISGSADFSGRFAMTMKPTGDSRKIFIEWWNEMRGEP